MQMFDLQEMQMQAAEPQEVAPFLDRLRRAHDRAQIRMAANRIPDRDPRELSRDEDADLGRLGF